MRLIDADALIKAIFDHCRSEAECLNHFYYDENIIALINNAPTVFDCRSCKHNGNERECVDCHDYSNYVHYEERPQGEWIPVSERLPKQGNQSYLVTVDYGDGVVCSCQRFFFSENIGWNDDCVVAWQPLPEQYKEGGVE